MRRLNIQFISMFSYYLLQRDVVKEPQGPCLKNQEISRNSRFLNSRQEIQCQEMVKTRKTKFLILKIKTRQEV